MKKVFIMAGMLGFMLAFGIETAEAQTTAGQENNNWLSLEIVSGITGGSLRYERVINNSFSICVVGNLNFWRESTDENWSASFFRLGALLAARFYPVDFPVFIELGAGGEIEVRNNEFLDSSENRFRTMIVPAVGARLGGEAGFFVSPFISFPISFVDDWVSDERWTVINFRAGVGLGWAW